MRRAALCFLAAALCAFAWALPVHASGFQIDLHDARGTGRSFANTAGVDDASAIYFNAAAMSEIDGISIRTGAHWLEFPIDYDPDPGQGQDAETRPKDFLVPNVFAAFDISEVIDAGLGIFVPFALATKWPGDFAGRYMALDNSITFIFVEPAVSAEIPFVDGLSVGFGLELVFGEVSLNRALDFRFLGEPDGELTMSGRSGITVGYHLSVLYSLLDDRVRLGASWRHIPDDTELDGDADFRNVPAVTGISDTDIETDLTLPPWFQVGAEVEILKDLLWVEMDYKWTGWHTLDRVHIDFDDNTAVADTTLPFEWHNVSMGMVAVEARPIPMVAVRAGYFYDQAPIPRSRLRPELPDSARNGISFGVGISMGSFRIDLSYMHIFIRAAHKDNLEGADSPGGPATANGHYNAMADIIGFSLGTSF